MSIKLMAAAWEVELPASDKLVLLALADWANDQGQCWPSIKQLCHKSGTGERTVQGCIKRLSDAGHLTRKENAGKGVFYTIHPGKALSMQGYTPPEHHYVYRVTDLATGEFYIGARSCGGDIAEDKYMGSGNWVKAKLAEGAQLQKQVVQVYPSREALALGELAHVSAEFQSELCRNSKLPSPGTLTKTGYRATPANFAPRRNCPPQNTAKTPADFAPNTSITVIKSKRASPSHSTRAKPVADFVLPTWVPADAWAGFEAMRKAAKKPLTDRARELALKRLEALAAKGHDPGAVLDQSTMNNWQGLFEIKEPQDGNGMAGHHRNGTSTGQPLRGSRTMDFLRSVQRELQAERADEGSHGGISDPLALPGRHG